MQNYDEIQKHKPLGADVYFIDHTNEIVYLKDNNTKVYAQYIGWEDSDLSYIEKFEIRPL